MAEYLCQFPQLWRPDWCLLKINFQTCTVHSGHNWLMELQFRPAAASVNAMPCYMREEVCVHCRSCSEECRRPGKHRQQKLLDSALELLPHLSSHSSPPDGALQAQCRRSCFSHTPHHQLPWLQLFCWNREEQKLTNRGRGMQRNIGSRKARLEKSPRT